MTESSRTLVEEQEEALDPLREAVWRDPGDARAHYDLGQALYEALDFEGALASFRDASDACHQAAGLNSTRTCAGPSTTSSGSGTRSMRWPGEMSLGSGPPLPGGGTSSQRSQSGK